MASWKPITARIGLDAECLASGLLGGACSYAFSRADARARLSATVIGGYWADASDLSTIVAVLEDWSPMTIVRGHDSIPVVIRTVTIARAADEPGGLVYVRAQSALADIVASLPEDEQYEALPVGWERVVE
jgi:hypothetical protein